jgi:hypothetical protein
MSPQLTLMTLFLVKHFLADFPLQPHGSMKGSRVLTEWVPDLILHCQVHTLLTCLIVLCLDVPDKVAAGVVTADFVLHLIIDRIKAHPDLGGRWKPNQKAFWVALGLDQLAHGLCYVAYVHVLTRN